VRLIRSDLAPRRVTKADRDAYKKRILEIEARMKAGGVIGRTDWSKTRFKDHMPPIEAMFISGNGDLWLSDSRVSPRDPQTWRIFDAKGIYVASVTLPARFEMSDADRTSVIGIYYDEDDEPEMRAYAIAN
jgi:hypothetical protein